MEVVFLIFIGVIVFLFLPLTLRISLSFDALQNRGELKLKFLSIRLLAYKFYFGINRLIVTGKKGKVYETQLLGEGHNNNFFEVFLFLLLRDMKYKGLKFYALAGVEGNAALTSQLCALVGIPTDILFKQLSARKLLTAHSSIILPNFCATTLRIALNLGFEFNLFVIFKNLILAVIKLKKGERHGAKVFNK
jgi:hypothetical protein